MIKHIDVKNNVKVYLDSQASSDAIGILVELSDLSDHVRAAVLESGNSSLEYFVANEGSCIAEDLVVITIFKFKVVESSVSHAKCRLLGFCSNNLARGQKIIVANPFLCYQRPDVLSVRDSAVRSDMLKQLAIHVWRITLTAIPR